MKDTIKALGIDYGDARIGVAISDDLGMMAHPVETIANDDPKNRPEDRIADLVAERKVDMVVIGMPFRMDGSEGDATAKVRNFIEKLQAVLPDGVEIEEIDERLSTVEAQSQLKASGRKAKDSKQVIDQVAATVILQDWLDNREDSSDDDDDFRAGMLGDDDDDWLGFGDDDDDDNYF